MARRVWRGPSKQLSLDGGFPIRCVELHATALPGAACTGFVVEALSRPGATVACVPVDWLVLDWRFCGRLNLAANSLGKRTAVLFALSTLFITFSYRVPIEILPASVSATSDLGSAARIADFRNEASLSAEHRGEPDTPDDSNVERWTLALVECAAMELELGTQFAGVVSGVHCMEGQKRRRSL